MLTLLLVSLPLLNFLLIVTFGSLVNRRLLSIFVVSTMVLALSNLAFSFSDIVAGVVQHITLGNWISSGLFEVNWNLSFDSLTYIMLLVVLSVSTLVHLYSTEYMAHDPHLPRFFSYLSLFTFFMLLLVTSDNFISLFLGWEGVGLCSYLLISFWFTRVQANKAAIKAMVVNRIADLAFTVGIAAVFFTFQSIEFSVVFGLAPYMTSVSILFVFAFIQPVTLITILFFLGAMGKSAQIGLHTWLPDAMEGPTPVSALIHAATMVTAGVFLLIRSSPLYECSPEVLSFVTVVGAATAFMAGTVGLFQYDLKKVIAYSTCSQLGYMVFACGLSEFEVSIFHLANHAAFKALLFLSAGAVIHALSGEQDLRKLGGLLTTLPLTYTMFLIGSLALMGIPFLTGFYSKDLILEMAAATSTTVGTVAYYLGLVTAALTSFYSFRLLYLAFYGQSRAPRLHLAASHELSPRMATALLVLSIGSIFFGYFSRDLFVGFGTEFWSGAIHHSTASIGAQLAGEFLVQVTKFLPFIGSSIAIYLVYAVYTSLAEKAAIAYRHTPARDVVRFLSAKWYFDFVYNRGLNEPTLELAYRDTFSAGDKGFLEAFGPQGLSTTALQTSFLVRKFNTGYVFDLGMLLLVGMASFYLLSQGGTLPDDSGTGALSLFFLFVKKNWLSFITHVKTERGQPRFRFRLRGHAALSLFVIFGLLQWAVLSGGPLLIAKYPNLTLTLLFALGCLVHLMFVLIALFIPSKYVWISNLLFCTEFSLILWGGVPPLDVINLSTPAIDLPTNAPSGEIPSPRLELPEPPTTPIQELPEHSTPPKRPLGWIEWLRYSPDASWARCTLGVAGVIIIVGGLVYGGIKYENSITLKAQLDGYKYLIDYSSWLRGASRPVHGQALLTNLKELLHRLGPDTTWLVDAISQQQEVIKKAVRAGARLTSTIANMSAKNSCCAMTEVGKAVAAQGQAEAGLKGAAEHVAKVLAMSPADPNYSYNLKLTNGVVDIVSERVQAASRASHGAAKAVIAEAKNLPWKK